MIDPLHQVADYVGFGVRQRRVGQRIDPYAALVDDPTRDAHDGAVDDDLLEQLRRVRWRLAQGDDVPAYVVASNRTLMGIAMVRPTSLDALSSVHGMGKQRISKYGTPFVEAVRSWTGC